MAPVSPKSVKIIMKSPNDWLCPGVNCSEPPVKPGAGTWEWTGSYEYGTKILYTCGPYGNFLSSQGDLYEELWATCEWNRCGKGAVHFSTRNLQCDTFLTKSLNGILFNEFKHMVVDCRY